MPTLTSREGALTYGPGLPTMLINDRLFVMDSNPRMKDALLGGDTGLMVEAAQLGKAVGLDIVAILLSDPDLDEVELLPRITTDVHNEVGCPIGLDSRNAEAVAVALEAMKPYKCIVFTVNGEQEILDSMLPVIKRYGAVIAGMPMGHFDPRVPMTTQGRLKEARYILEVCQGYGIPGDDLVIDAICMAASTLEPEAFRVSLETLKAVHEELGLATQLGVSNAGHGMPDKNSINLAYLLGAMPWGLDSAFINPETAQLIPSVLGMDFLIGRDATGKRYINHWRSRRQKSIS